METLNVNNRPKEIKESSVMTLNKIIQIFLLCLLAFASINATAIERVTYFHNDALGSPVAATDKEGDLLWREEYEPYGERILNEDSGTNSLWFTAKQEEEDFGINYFGARWYDPSIGRFMGVDRVGFSKGNIQTFNKYAYANNNPYLFIDPDGKSAITKLVKFVIKGGDVSATFAGNIQDAATLMNSAAPPTSRILAAISLASELSPVSLGDAQDAYKILIKAKEGIKDLTKNRRFSKLDDITTPGSITNKKTDVTKSEFESNLVDSGFKQSTSKDGGANIFTKGDKKFTTRDSSKSTGGPTAEAFSGGIKKQKIRLGE